MSFLNDIICSLLAALGAAFLVWSIEALGALGVICQVCQNLIMQPNQQ
jgi:hypothetical protein